MNTPLNLETSQLIHSLVGDYEAEDIWLHSKLHKSCVDKASCVKTLYWTHVPRKSWEFERDTRFMDYDFVYPDPTFGEVIRILPKIGEKKGVRYLLGHPGLNNSQTWAADRGAELLQEYMFATSEPEAMRRVEEYLIKLIK